MQKTPIDRLQPGVFIVLENVGWMSHPFMFSAFCLSSQSQIDTLRELGLTEITWDPARSTAQPLPEASEAPPAEEDFGASALRGMLNEKRSRVEKVRQKREQFARREREYEKEVNAAGDILKSMAARPNEMHGQAKAMVGRVVQSLIGAENEVIQLVNSKSRDVGLALHAVNVMVLSLLLGKALKLSEEEMKQLGLGALLHDLGKAEVPARILRANPRTPPEEEFYRAHVGYGIKAAAGVRDLPQAVKNIIACHHEHFDGNGFPNRLVGEKIPRLARIVAIANRYENLCNPFDLKQAKSPAEAISYLFRNEAARFQPELLQRFVKTLGVYPPGSFVALSNAAVGLVIELNPADSLRPVLMLHDPEVPRNEALLLDLRETDLKITGALSPAKLPVAVVEYLAPRGRVDYYVEGVS